MPEKFYDAATLARTQRITLEAAEHIVREFGTNAKSCNAAARKLKVGKLTPGTLPLPSKRQIERLASRSH